MAAYSTCTPGCTNSHHTAMCVNDRMTIDESRLLRGREVLAPGEREMRHLIEDVYRYTPPLHITRPGQMAAVANNFRPEAAWPSLYSDELTPFMRSVEDLRNNILFFGMGIDTGKGNDAWTSYNFQLGTIERPLSPLSNMVPAVAVAEMPSPIKKPERDEILRREPIRAEDMPADVDAMQADLAMEAERLLGYSVMRTRLKLQDPLLLLLGQLEIEPYDGASVAQYKQEMLVYAQNEARRMDVAEGIDPDSYNRRTASWKCSSLDGYSKPVPEFAIDKALQIARVCPEAEFFIEELTVVPDPFLIVQLGRKRRYIEVWGESLFEAKNLSL